jgi:uncharacterized protein YjeT (DUF2065 family)
MKSRGLVTVGVFILVVGACVFWTNHSPWTFWKLHGLGEMAFGTLLLYVGLGGRN